MVIARIPIDITWTGATGSPGVNVWHGRWDGDLSGSAQLEGMLDAIEAFYDDIKTFYFTDTVISFAGDIYGLGPDEGDTAAYDPWEITGTGGGGHSPPEVQALVSWKTGSGGRRGRGRTFIGPLATGLFDGAGAFGGSNVATLLVAAETLIAASSGIGDGALGVFSRVDNVVRDFTSASVTNKTAVLRSRRD